MSKKINEISNITGMGASSSTISTGSGGGNNTSVNITKKDLSDPTLQQSIGKMKGASINIVDEDAATNMIPQLKYLSNVKDAKTGSVSQPFKMSEKNYQLCRAIDEKRNKVTGVLSLDETDAEGNHVIHSQDFFEKNIAKRPRPEATPKVITQEKKNFNLGEFKFFLVNSKTGKVRKFKTNSELAKAVMDPSETYMNFGQFKKYVNHKLFPSKRKKIEEDLPTPTDVHTKAIKFMGLLADKIPSSIIDSIKNNVMAQKEVIVSFAELIGVPKNNLQNLISSIQDINNTSQDSSTQSTSTQSTVTQSSPIQGTSTQTV
jgi:hypothetical protein